MPLSFATREAPAADTRLGSIVLFRINSTHKRNKAFSQHIHIPGKLADTIYKFCVVMFTQYANDEEVIVIGRAGNSLPFNFMPPPLT